MKIIIIKKNGEIDESDYTTNSDFKMLYKKGGFRKEKDFQRRHTWEIANGEFVSVYSKNVGRANTENKYELPPPVDSDLYFGKMVIIKHSEEIPTGESCQDLTSGEWKTVYEKLMGGFEDLDDNEEGSDEEYVAPEDLTKQGYKKDGFVVEDGNVDFNIDESEEEWVDEDETEDSLDAEEWMSSNNDECNEETDGDTKDEVEKVLVVITEVKKKDNKNKKIKKQPKKQSKKQSKKQPKKQEVASSDIGVSMKTGMGGSDSGSDEELQEEDYEY